MWIKKSVNDLNKMGKEFHMSKMNDQDQRIEEILGSEGEQDFEEATDIFLDHLRKNLRLPCEVTGIEDFDWEEFYVFGPGDQKAYERMKENQPSFEDRYDLLAIEKDVFSEWMMFGGEDIGAQVRRKSDGKEFRLGLAELEAIDKKTSNYQLLDDYAVWFVNNR